MERDSAQSGAVRGVSKALWRSVFRSFLSIVKLNPWSWLGKYDFFGIQTGKDSEPVFLHFHESDSSANPGLSMVFGWNGEALFRHVVAGGEDHQIMRSYEIPLVRVFMRPFGEITEAEKEIFEASGCEPDAAGRVPVFVCYKPGWMPWILDEGDAEYCSAVLNQALGVLLRAETDKTIVSRENPGEVWVHSFDEETASWQGVWEPLRPLKDFVPGPKAALSAALVEKVNALPVGYDSVEADIDIVPKIALVNADVVKKAAGGRIPLGYLLAVADAATGACIGNCVFYPCNDLAQMWDSVPAAIFKFFLATGRRPKEIAVSSFATMGFLRKIQTQVRFKLTFHSKLPKADALIEKTRVLVDEALKGSGYDKL